MMNWEQQRDNNIAKRDSAMEETRLARMESAVKTGRTLDLPQATAAQIELFAVAPNHFDYVEKLLSDLPRKRQREHFRNVWLRAYRSVKDDGSISFSLGNKQARIANTTLRDVLTNRLEAVFEQYQISVSWLLERKRYSANLAMQKPVDSQGLHFYLLGERQLKEIAYKLALHFNGLQSDFVEDCANQKAVGLLSAVDFSRLSSELHRLCADVCKNIGFPLKSQHRLEEGKRLSVQQQEGELLRVVCEKYWFRTLRSTQKRLIEHLAIGCGEVSAKVSPYISTGALSDYRNQQKANLEYLKQMIIENIDDPSEQVELMAMWQKSSGNPAIRFNEMMNRLRGVDEWATEKGYVSLFLTMTAPSSFHATHNNGTNNKKWKGADPRTTHAYLSKNWAQLRALFAKRGIGFFGMRGVEPHHDATPHWHLLVYVKAEDKEEVIRLFKSKALELDGDEFGAKKHRCRVDEIDPAKGSAVSYIAKYIAKNIYAGNQKDETSDEVEGLKLDENVQRVRAWANLWGIRQFQFYGNPPISVWRELRKLEKWQLDDVDDKTIADAQAVCDVACFASYLELQGGAMAKREDQPLCVEYEESEPNQYGETRKKIVGVKNRFSLASIRTKLKNWVIKKGTVADVAPDANAETTETNKERSDAWTCVSNCNRSEIEQKVKNALLPVGFMINRSQIDLLIKHKRLRLNDFQWICYENDNVFIKEEKIPLFSVKKFSQKVTGFWERLGKM